MTLLVSRLHYNRLMPKKSKSKPAAAIKRIYIVEDHPVFREGLVEILQSEKDLSVCGEAGSAEEALPAIAKLKPDLVLVDITLPGISGLELIKRIRARDCDVKLLVVSMRDEALYAARVLRAGGDGYIMKQQDPEEIVQAIRDVIAGRIYVSEEVLVRNRHAPPKRAVKAASSPIDQLTDAELEILGLLGRGDSNQEIARHLRSNAREVATHCRQIKKKLHLKSPNALVRYAVCWVEAAK